MFLRRRRNYPITAAAEVPVTKYWIICRETGWDIDIQTDVDYLTPLGLKRVLMKAARAWTMPVKTQKLAWAFFLPHRSSPQAIGNRSVHEIHTSAIGTECNITDIIQWADLRGHLPPKIGL